MNEPLVCALLATNRPQFQKRAYDQYCKQDYKPLLLLTDASERTHGAKMDRLIRKCIAEFFVVHDDDDDYAPNRVSKLIHPMLHDESLLCVGTSLIYFLDERVGKAWLYDNQKVCEGWKANADNLFWLGAPAYRRSTYDLYGPWEDLKCGADLRFLHKIPRERILDLRDPTLMVCRIHGNNAAAKEPHPPAWEEVPMCEVPAV
jgi:hypothetical protein